MSNKSGFWIIFCENKKQNKRDKFVVMTVLLVVLLALCNISTSYHNGRDWRPWWLVKPLIRISVAVIIEGGTTMLYPTLKTTRQLATTNYYSAIASKKVGNMGLTLCC